MLAFRAAREALRQPKAGLPRETCLCREVDYVRKRAIVTIAEWGEGRIICSDQVLRSGFGSGGLSESGRLLYPVVDSGRRTVTGVSEMIAGRIDL
jgi:hypothetical protein